MLDVDRLVKHYSSGDELVRPLDGVSLSVGDSEMVALYGPSGSGKTTLLSVIASLLAPDSGRVFVSGREVSGLSARQAAEYRKFDMGYVSQAPHLLPGVPAIDNAALKLFGCRLTVREAHRRVTPLLERLGLGARLHHRPEQLSVGECQRVLIARALSTSPKLLLADEPTGSLDARRSKDVLTLLTEICVERGVAMLLVTHDPQAAAFADRAHALVEGHLVDYEPEVSLLRSSGP